jgi:hypothetical protein
MSDAGAPEVAADPVTARKEQQAQDLARVKEAGWTNPIPFKYESVVGGTPAEDETRNTAVWLSDAAIYQWDDDFGDVGEPNPDLEVRIFSREAIQGGISPRDATQMATRLSTPLSPSSYTFEHTLTSCLGICRICSSTMSTSSAKVVLSRPSRSTLPSRAPLRSSPSVT